MLHAGDRLDRYVVERLLGAGTFAAVYLVRHEVLRSRHAIKLLDPRWLENGGIRERFLAEGRILAQLRHPNLVAVTDVFEDGPQRVGLVMEYVEGPTLADVVARRGALPVPDAIAIIRGIADGLHHAHEAGIVHRDLKPDNIVVVRTEDGPRPVILDFGIAKILTDTALDASRVDATRATVRLGTPQYMSPEQIEASHAVDRRTDVFALGAILYELLLGRPAFDGATATEIMYRVTQGAYRVPEGLPLSLSSVIARALCVDPGGRFATTRDLRAALDDITAGGVDPLPLAQGRRALPTLAPGFEAGIDTPAATDTDVVSRPSRAPWLALAGALLLGAAGLGIAGIAGVAGIASLQEAPGDQGDVPDDVPAVADAPQDEPPPPVDTPVTPAVDLPVELAETPPAEAPADPPPATTPVPRKPRPVTDSDRINAAWKGLAPSLEACAEPGTAWKVAVDVDTAGRVTGADVSRTGRTGDPATRKCLAERVGAMKSAPLDAATRRVYTVQWR